MATGANSTAAAQFLRRMYTPDFIINTISKKESRLLSLIKHDEGGEGDSVNDLTIVGDNPSGSADFTEAKNRGENSMSDGRQWNIPWYDDYEHPTVSGKLIAQSRGKKGGWFPHLKHEMKSSLRMSAHRRSVALYTAGWGELGVMSNAPAANGNVVLADPSTVFRFVKGQKLVFAPTIATSVLRAGQSAIVTGVNYAAYRNAAPTAHLTLDTNTNAIAGLAQNDIIFTKGDRQDSATPTKRRPTGLDGWASVVAPVGGENFFGQDRSTNSFLAAWIIDGVTQGPLQALIEACTMTSTVGSAENLIAVTSVQRFMELSVALQGQVRYTEVKGRGGVGFKTIAIYADGIEVPLLCDKYCRYGVSYVGEPHAFYHPSLGAAPHIAADDGQEIVRQTDDDGVAVRVRAFETFELRNGAAWAVVQHP